MLFESWNCSKPEQNNWKRTAALLALFRNAMALQGYLYSGGIYSVFILTAYKYKYLISCMF